jgi:hypothetical protein
LLQKVKREGAEERRGEERVKGMDKIKIFI